MSNESRTTKCYKCSVDICMGADQLHELQATGKIFYCVNGHGQVFGDGCVHQQELQTEVDRLRRQVREASRTIAMAYAESRRCPWPGCRDYVYSSRGGMYAHMRQVHGMPMWLSSEDVA